MHDRTNDEGLSQTSSSPHCCATSPHGADVAAINLLLHQISVEISSFSLVGMMADPYRVPTAVNPSP